MRGMKAALLAGLMVLALCACNLKLSSSTDIIDLDNTSYDPSPSGHFTTAGKWDILMNYDCTKQKSEGIAGIDTFDMIVYNADDMSSNSEHPELHLQGVKKTETLHFYRSGTFHISVDSRCDWRVRVLDRSA